MIKKHKTPLVLTHNRFLPSISSVVRKHWNIPNTSRAIQGLYQEEPFTAFKKIRNLKELIRNNCIKTEKLNEQKIHSP